MTKKIIPAEKYPLSSEKLLGANLNDVFLREDQKQKNAQKLEQKDFQIKQWIDKKGSDYQNTRKEERIELSETEQKNLIALLDEATGLNPFNSD